MPRKSKTRFLLLSDTHTLTPSPRTATSIPYRHPLPPSQVLLHAGDLTKVGLKSEHALTLSMLTAHPAELKIVIAGNHDITLDEEYYTSVGWRRHRFRRDDGKDHLVSLPRTSTQDIAEAGTGTGYLEDPAEIKALYTSPEAIAAGIRYLDEGVQTFTVPSTGARFRVYASAYTPEFCNWAFAYPRGVDWFNSHNHHHPSTSTTSYTSSSAETETETRNVSRPENEGRKEGGVPVPDYPAVDILLTHGPPHGILDFVPGAGNVGCESLYRAVERSRPALHVFGHIHEGYGARRVEWDVDAGDETGGGTGQVKGKKRVEEIEWDRETVLEERCAYADLTAGSERPLRRGEETLFVNASVVTVEYQPLNAPWVVDLDLDVDEGGVY
ncbi:Metallo-dependent phosphatase-like protein [Aspergillus egyptiacus]|nr:Metallo-dependent phosphatase-like protein [Aspergillus egyptiacus]